MLFLSAIFENFVAGPLPDRFWQFAQTVTAADQISACFRLAPARASVLQSQQPSDPAEERRQKLAAKCRLAVAPVLVRPEFRLAVLAFVRAPVVFFEIARARKDQLGRRDLHT